MKFSAAFGDVNGPTRAPPMPVDILTVSRKFLLTNVSSSDGAEV